MTYTIKIIQADNDEALASRSGYSYSERWKWDICRLCPIARAFDRDFPPHEWLVNRNGARPKGALAYWYRFSSELRDALRRFDVYETPILGEFKIYDQVGSGAQIKP